MADIYQTILKKYLDSAGGFSEIMVKHE